MTKAVAGISLTDSLEGEIQAEDVGEVDVQAWNFSRMKNWKLYISLAKILSLTIKARKFI